MLLEKFRHYNWQKEKYMAQLKANYQEPNLEILFLVADDVVKTSNGDDFGEDIFD